MQAASTLSRRSLVFSWGVYKYLWPFLADLSHALLEHRQKPVPRCLQLPLVPGEQLLLELCKPLRQRLCSPTRE